MLYHKTARTNGTRCVQHKLKAANILLKQYGLIVLALIHITGDAKMKKIKGYVKQMTFFKTLALLHLFVDLLAPISKLSGSSPCNSCKCKGSHLWAVVQGAAVA